MFRDVELKRKYLEPGAEPLMMVPIDCLMYVLTVELYASVPVAEFTPLCHWQASLYVSHIEVRIPGSDIYRVEVYGFPPCSFGSGAIG